MATQAQVIFLCSWNLVACAIWAWPRSNFFFSCRIEILNWKIEKAKLEIIFFYSSTWRDFLTFFLEVLFLPIGFLTKGLLAS